jgi:hypothetical protein
LLWKLGIVHNAFEVVASILESNPVIDCITLVTYTEAVNWREKPLPNEGTDATVALEGLRQDRHERILTRVSRSEFSNEHLRGFAASLSDYQLLGVASRVSLVGGGEAHIPMMDFLCSLSVENSEMLVQLLAALRNGKGFLLQSGRSYHYYGVRLLTEGEWRVFLGKCLLMSGYSDDRYIGHQLVDGYCALRLSAGKLKNQVPAVVAEIL